MLQVEKLTKYYGQTLAIEDITFNVARGHMLGLLGPNGAGKTTILRIALNILKASSGEVYLDGKKIPPHFKNMTGYLPEERGLYKKSNVMDVLIYFGKLKGMTRNDAFSRAKGLLSRMDIENYSGRKIEELSKGNQQKIQFIATIIHDPAIIFLDEPFSGFDPLTREFMKEMIAELLSKDKIMILSTHQLELAEELCKDIFLINKGRRALSGSLADIKNSLSYRKFGVCFSGELQSLDKLPFDISNITKQKDDYVAEIKLSSSIPEDQILKTVSEKVKLKEFYRILPGLNEIFLDTIANRGL